MRKKLFYGILILILSLSIFSCNAKTASTEKEAFDIVIKELDTDLIVQKIDTFHLEDKLLVFFMTGNEYQAHEYGYAEFHEKNAKYKFSRTYRMYNRGMDIRSSMYKDSYFFVINNPDCKSLQILYNGNETIVEVENIPFVYLHNGLGNMEYNFLDENGTPLYP